MRCRNHSSSSPWQTGKVSSGSSSQAAAKLSDAAKAAAKRAAQFAKQRQQRAYQLAQEQQDADNISTDANTPSTSTGYVFSTKQQQSRGYLQPPTQTAALAAKAAANAAAGQYSDLKPYIEVVTAHLKQHKPAGNDNNSSSSSSGGGRGRGAKKAAARSLLEAHTAVFQAALDLELQQEWSEAEDRLKVQRLAALPFSQFTYDTLKGTCLFRTAPSICTNLHIGLQTDNRRNCQFRTTTSLRPAVRAQHFLRPGRALRPTTSHHA